MMEETKAQFRTKLAGLSRQQRRALLRKGFQQHIEETMSPREWSLPRATRREWARNSAKEFQKMLEE